MRWLWSPCVYTVGEARGQAVYNTAGQVLYGYQRFGRSATAWVTDLAHLAVDRVAVGALETASGKPFATSLQLVVGASPLSLWREWR